MAQLNLIKTILEECSSYPELSKEEEIDCFQNYLSSKDETYRDRVILSHLKQVVSLANGFVITHPNKSISKDDLVASGYEGLLMAFDKFDLSKNCRFSTIAQLYIVEEMRKYYDDATHKIHVPDNVLKQLAHIQKRKNEFMNECGYEPSISELSEYMNEEVYSPEKIEEVYLRCSEIDSLDRPLTCDDDMTLIDVHQQDGDYEIIEGCPNSILYFHLMEEVEKLSEREYYVFVHSTGIDNNKKMTLDEMASELNISKDSVRKIKESVINYLKTKVEDIVIS